MSRWSSGGAVRLWLEDHLLHVPRQNISAHVPMRLDVSSIGPANRMRHRIRDEFTKRLQSQFPHPQQSGRRHCRQDRACRRQACESASRCRSTLNNELIFLLGRVLSIGFDVADPRSRSNSRARATKSLFFLPPAPERDSFRLARQARTDRHQVGKNKRGKDSASTLAFDAAITPN